MARATAHPDHHLISSEDVEGIDVYGIDGVKIGESDHLMIDKVSGRITYAVISFGGFLGIGHSHYPVPWAALKYEPKLGGYITDITQEKLKDAPAFSDSNTEPSSFSIASMCDRSTPPPSQAHASFISRPYFASITCHPAPSKNSINSAIPQRR